MFITETETTGPVVRVWVAGIPEAFAAAGDGTEFDVLEGEALGLAKESLGTDALAETVYHDESGLLEVIFEAGDLA